MFISASHLELGEPIGQGKHNIVALCLTLVSLPVPNQFWVYFTPEGFWVDFSCKHDVDYFALVRAYYTEGTGAWRGTMRNISHTSHNYFFLTPTIRNNLTLCVRICFIFHRRVWHSVQRTSEQGLRFACDKRCSCQDVKRHVYLVNREPISRPYSQAIWRVGSLCTKTGPSL